MASSVRRSRSALSTIAPKSSLRWLISIADIPRPCQSRSSACARSSTGSGSIAGPALKFHTRRVKVLRRSLVAAVGLRDALESGELLAFVEVDEAHPLRRAAHLADRRDGGADQHPAGRNQHHLV